MEPLVMVQGPTFYRMMQNGIVPSAIESDEDAVDDDPILEMLLVATDVGGDDDHIFIHNTFE